MANKIVISEISLDENFHVGAIVSKLPPSWKEYRSKLLHKKEDLTLEKLLQHLQIEQETRWHDNNSLKEPVIKAHMVEEKSNKKKPENKNFSKNSQSRKEERKNKLKNDLVAMVTEAYVAKDQVEWWIDTGATRHISDPESYAEAMFSHDAPFWREAIDDEMHSILSNNTWILSDPPPGSRMTSIHLLIALAAIHGFVIHQMDVKTKFQNGDLDKEVHMKQPEGFVNPGQERKVYDTLIFGIDIERVKETKYFFASQFEMKDIGEADVILGIKIIRSASGLTLTQSSYIEKVLKRFGHFDNKPAPTPFDPSIKLVRNSGDILDQLTYSQIVGSLMYAMHCIRPDIDYAVETLSKFTGSPGVEHWNTLIRVLRYLKGTINVGLHYSTFSAVLEGYTISWRSKKQTCITHSTMESEFIAMSSAGEETDWLRSMLIDIPLWVPGAEGLVVRVVSSVDKKLEVKSWVLDIFKEENYPLEFPYKSKRIESVEVCLFGMYVHEFGSECAQPNHRRVHLSLLDSVKYFRPEIKTVSVEALRTFVYHEILVIFVPIFQLPIPDIFYWYLSMLRKAEENIVVELTNLYNHFFKSMGECKTKVTAARLPYFYDDYWPVAAEDIICQLQQEEDERKKHKKGIIRKIITKIALKASGQFDLSGNASKDLRLMHKCPSQLERTMTNSTGYVPPPTTSRCYETEQKLEDIERHPINQKEKHTLYQSEIKEVPHDTKDEDEILESEFFDTRQDFWSLCQESHYQYDTLRHAKHSSMMVLCHLHNPTAPVFCDICYLDIEAGQGWRCEVCADYDVCNACYQKDGGINHPHKLTNHPSSADCDAQNKEARQPLVLQVSRVKVLRLNVMMERCINYRVDAMMHCIANSVGAQFSVI
ncbi:Histone acetyltransferase HAC4 [Capsicum annuum]|nr:Histone acetyltransferase HAC4 [Capsicum annuum]